MQDVDAVVETIQKKPHSFHHIRRRTGLKITDNQFMDLIRQHQDRFAFTRIQRKDAEGNRVRPGWPGVKLKDGLTA